MTEDSITGRPAPDSRRFGLGDAMILIIALALGLGLARPAIAIVVDAMRSDPGWRFQTIAGAVSLTRIVNIIVLNFLLFLIPAFLIVRLRRPRPSWRSLIRQPGFASCAGTVAVVLGLVVLSLIPAPGLAAQAIEITGQILIVAVVPLLWIVMLATRRWTPEPGWIDRLGRVLGLAWMVVTPAHLVLIRLPY